MKVLVGGSDEIFRTYPKASFSYWPEKLKNCDPQGSGSVVKAGEDFVIDCKDLQIQGDIKVVVYDKNVIKKASSRGN